MRSALRRADRVRSTSLRQGPRPRQPSDDGQTLLGRLSVPCRPSTGRRPTRFEPKSTLLRRTGPKPLRANVAVWSHFVREADTADQARGSARATRPGARAAACGLGYRDPPCRGVPRYEGRGRAEPASPSCEKPPRWSLDRGLSRVPARPRGSSDRDRDTAAVPRGRSASEGEPCRCRPPPRSGLTEGRGTRVGLWPQQHDAGPPHTASLSRGTRPARPSTGRDRPCTARRS